MQQLLPLFLFCLPLCGSIQAQSREAIKKTTDIGMFLPAATGLVLSLCKQDHPGTKQLAFSALTGIAASYGLKYAVRKERPDGSDRRAFPSNHTSAAFMGAVFLQRRYGWKWGLPAGILAAYVGWGRIYAKRHDGWDVLGGAAIGCISSLAFTRPFGKGMQFSLTPTVIGKQYPGFYAAIRW